MQLNELHDLPAGILEMESHQLGECLPGPSLIHLAGEKQEAVFVSVLQHGNEDTGWLAVRALLKRYNGRTLPRALSLFISNVEAARYRVRRLEHQIDYNRVWPGCDSTGTDEHRLMREVWEVMRGRNVFASIDIHNNTGSNPHYACINRLDWRFVCLARLFSKTLVYFIKPIGVQSLAFAQLCPSVTVECGQPGEAGGIEHAQQFIDNVLKLDEIGHEPDISDAKLFHTVASVKVPDHISVGFAEQGERDLMLVDDIDRLNFVEQPAGTVFARVCEGERYCVEVWNETGQEVSADYFELRDDLLVTRRPLMPSMLTRDVRIIKQDCLCYLMERMALPG